MRTPASNVNSSPKRKSRVVSWRTGSSTALTVCGYGLRFFVDRGRLIIEDGFVNEGPRRRTVFSRGTCRLQRIILLGHTGMITLDALQWLADMGVATLFVGLGGRLVSVCAPGGLERNRVRLHRAQALAKDSAVGVSIARTLIMKKLQGQCGVLEWLTDPGSQVPLAERDRRRQMRDAAAALRIIAERVDQFENIEGIMEAERAGAEVYWRALQGMPVLWKSRAATKIPEHWHRTQARESYRTGNRNGATDPTNSLLNYGYSLLEAATRIACLSAGLHSGLGVFHADRDGRDSFVYDLMEPVRPVVDRLVLELIRKHEFSEGECWETREGYCRLDPDLATRLTPWMTRLSLAATPVVREVAVLLDEKNGG